ncbi:MAG: hypothetical protein PHN72_03855 [Bacilli bacterium]|nr:hypothetical protein [Bacilli bacterium]
MTEILYALAVVGGIGVVPAVLIGGTRLIQIRAMHNKIKRMGYKKVKKVEKLSLSERFLYSFEKEKRQEILLNAFAVFFPLVNLYVLWGTLVNSKKDINDTIQKEIEKGTLVKIEKFPVNINNNNALIDRQEKEQSLTTEEKINFDFSDMRKKTAPIQMTKDERSKELRKELEALESTKEQELEDIKQNKIKKGPYTPL